MHWPAPSRKTGRQTGRGGSSSNRGSASKTLSSVMHQVRVNVTVQRDVEVMDLDHHNMRDSDEVHAGFFLAPVSLAKDCGRRKEEWE